MRIMGYISIFEKITKTHAVDFLESNGQLIFFVNEGKASKAVGKAGVNIKKLTHLLKKKVKIIQLTKDPIKFIEGLIHPIKPAIIEVHGDRAIVQLSSVEDKARVIGRNASRLKFINQLLESHLKMKATIQ